MKNVGTGNTAALATYIVEKGKPVVAPVDCQRNLQKLMVMNRARPHVAARDVRRHLLPSLGLDSD
jgi:hypothetical protein